MSRAFATALRAQAAAQRVQADAFDAMADALDAGPGRAEPELLTAAEAAALSGVGERRLRALVASGEVRGHRLGREVRVDRAGLLAYVRAAAPRPHAAKVRPVTDDAILAAAGVRRVCQ